MTLEPGRVLSHYKIVSKIGAGGMGEVWRATDTNLGRDVALKILPASLSADTERLARFDREARLLASLNHPNIAAVYEAAEAEGFHFLAMELVSGHDLSTRLEKGAVPVEETIRLALGVAEALEAAHERGIVHRDLKPSNIMIADEDAAGSTAAGARVKVLDFGLAKALEGDQAAAHSDPRLSFSPTVTAMTAAHVILGTAAYMSPEQARGQATDRRSDIWAFGVVLYEMLTGTRAFEGETVSDILAGVLKSDLDWSALPKGIPSRLRRLLERCLERDRRRRLRDIGEARLVLEELATGAPDKHVAAALAAGEVPRSTTGDASADTDARTTAVRRSPLAWLLPAAAGLALGALAVFGLVGGRGTNAEQPTRVRKLLAPDVDLTEEVPRRIVLAPDGQAVACLMTTRIIVQDFSSVESRTFELDHSPESIFWSPDGRSLGILGPRALQRLDVTSGGLQTICDELRVTRGSGGHWAEPEVITFSEANEEGLQTVAARGGTPRLLAPIDSTEESDFHEPFVLSGNRGILVVPHRSPNTFERIELITPKGRKTLFEAPGAALSTPLYSDTGHILFYRSTGSTGIWALPFSLERLEATGDPFLVVGESSNPTVAPGGLLAYVDRGTGRLANLTMNDAKGTLLKDLGPVNFEAPTTWMDATADGRRVAFSDQHGDAIEVWMTDVERGSRTRLSFLAGANNTVAWPAWLPGEERLLVQHGHSRGGPVTRSLLRISADGSGSPDSLLPGTAGQMSPDGRYIVSTQNPGTSGFEIYIADSDGSNRRLLVGGEQHQRDPAVAPNGRFIAYTSNESDQYEVYLRRFPDGEGRWQVSTAGGLYPRWNGRGDRLYYLSGETIMEVEIDLAGMPVLSTPRPLFTRQPTGLALPPPWPGHFDVTADGQRFFYYRPGGATTKPARLVVVDHWFAEFAAGR
jgi:hypothetical protein